MLTPAPTNDPTPVVDPVNHQAGQTAVGAGVLIVAGVMAWGATAIPADAGYSGVGPNFLPWVVSAALMVCGALLLWQARTGGYQHMSEPSGASKGDWPALAWVCAGVIANASLITSLGFIFSCALCFVLAVRGLRLAEGHRDASLHRTLKDLLTGLSISAPVFWLFTKVLAVNLPALTATGWL